MGVLIYDLKNVLSQKNLQWLSDIKAKLLHVTNTLPTAWLCIIQVQYLI